MGYKKADCILPKDLLAAVQQYIDGEYIYIPRKFENRKQWGVCNNSRHQLDKRNGAILEQYKSGTSVAELAERYYLSPKSVYKILSVQKKINK